MDRMLATQDEIDMAMKEQMVDDFKRAGGMKLMLDENARTWERWYQKVKEEAEAKVLEKAMKDLEEADRKDIADAIEAKREQVASEMGQDDFWRADEMVRMNGGNLDILADFNLTPEEYQEELKKRGGSFEAALDAQMKDSPRKCKNPDWTPKPFMKMLKRLYRILNIKRCCTLLNMKPSPQRLKLHCRGR